MVEMPERCVHIWAIGMFPIARNEYEGVCKKCVTIRTFHPDPGAVSWNEGLGEGSPNIYENKRVRGQVETVNDSYE